MPHNCYFNNSQSEFLFKDGYTKRCCHRRTESLFHQSCREVIDSTHLERDPDTTGKHQVNPKTYSEGLTTAITMFPKFFYRQVDNRCFLGAVSLSPAFEQDRLWVQMHFRTCTCVYKGSIPTYSSSSKVMVPLGSASTLFPQNFSLG